MPLWRVAPGWGEMRRCEAGTLGERQRDHAPHPSFSPARRPARNGDFAGRMFGPRLARPHLLRRAGREPGAAGADRLHRWRRGRRAARGDHRARRAGAWRQRRGCRRGTGLRALGHAALAGLARRRGRLPRLCPDPPRGRGRAARRRSCSPRCRRRRPAATGRPRCRCWRAGSMRCYARYGSRPFGELVIPAEQMARFGVPVSRAFAQRSRRWSAGPLLADPNARAIFGPNGTPLAEGQMLVQPDLGGDARRSCGWQAWATSIRASLRTGWRTPRGWPAARSMLATCARALPRVAGALDMAAGSDRAAFLPPPADGGLAALAAFAALRRDPRDPAAAAARALQVAAALARRRRRSAGGRWQLHGRRAAAAAAAGLDQLRRARSQRRRGRLRDQHEQPVRHRPGGTGHRDSARRVAGRGTSRRCCRPRSPTTRTCTPSAPPSPAPGRRARRWRSRSACRTRWRAGRRCRYPVPEPGRANVIVLPALSAGRPRLLRLGDRPARGRRWRSGRQSMALE